MARAQSAQSTIWISKCALTFTEKVVFKAALGTSIPFVVKGTSTNPVVTPDVTGVAASEVKRIGNTKIGGVDANQVLNGPSSARRSSDAGVCAANLSGEFVPLLHYRFRAPRGRCRREWIIQACHVYEETQFPCRARITKPENPHQNDIHVKISCEAGADPGNFLVLLVEHQGHWARPTPLRPGSRYHKLEQKRSSFLKFDSAFGAIHSAFSHIRYTESIGSKCSIEMLSGIRVSMSTSSCAATRPALLDRSKDVPYQSTRRESRRAESPSTM